MSDFRFTNQGSICILTPISDAGRAWREENLPAFGDNCQNWGKDGVVIEPRYAGPILEGIQAEGLTLA